MSLNVLSQTESLQFSESDSIVPAALSSMASFEDDQGYLITRIHYASKYKKDNVETFSTHTPVIVKIVNVQYCPVRHIWHTSGNDHNDLTKESQDASLKERTKIKFNPYIYEIQVEYGQFMWTLFRRYNEFLAVHDKIVLRVAAMKLPIPTKKASARRETFKEEIKRQSIKGGRKKRTLPPFPKRPEIFVTDEDIVNRKSQLEAYLQGVLSYKVFHTSFELHKFFEVSIVSFISCLGSKRKEGIVKKRCGGRLVFTGCFEFINSLTSRYDSRWLFVKDTFVAYMETRESRIGDVLLMDNEFKVFYGSKDTGKSKGIIISNKHRRLFCICQTSNRLKEWVSSINAAMETTGKEFIQTNNHQSFAPLREETYSRWYIDGERYMTAVSNAIENAKEEIYIADWWLSPEIHMKRPAKNNYWRLDKILLRKAEEGVLIFVLLFKEIEITLNINSQYTKNVLSKLHPNIQVLRHPDHIKRRTLFWSHHEKMVIIDQKICFLGGVDLCFGRWDTLEHSIQDIMEDGIPETSIIADEDLHLLVDNKRLMGETIHVPSNKSSFLNTYSVFGKGQHYLGSIREKRRQSSPKQKGVSFRKFNKEVTNNHNANNGKNVIEDSFIQCRTSHFVDYIKLIIDKLPRKYLNKQKVLNNSNNSITTNNDDQDNVKTLFEGKDYVNWIIKDCVNLDRPDIDLIDRQTTPRMPWHDISCVVYGRAARDGARHFIQRWNAVKKEKAKNNSKYNILVPKGYSHSEVHRITVIKSYVCTCQVLRSVSRWSANINSSENSILNAYIETIRKAKHYIYIENQYFISSITDKSDLIKNEIGKEILDRIVYFHKKSKLFRVYILLPLLPAFESDLVGNKVSSLHTVLNYNYKTLFRGSDSLFGSLKRMQIDPMKYIFIGSLRNFGIIGDKLSTEQIYVHSKLMIVDDLYSIIGSANINDRSLLGFRDSEVAIWFKDEHFKKAKFDNLEVKVGNFSSTLRKALMAEHLGIDEKNEDQKEFFDVNLLNDPVGDPFFLTIWYSTAKQNTELFDEIFSCFPSNSFTNFANYHKIKDRALLKSDPDLAMEKVLSIQGHLVLYPTSCLEEENLEPSLVTPEGYMPVDLWI